MKELKSIKPNITYGDENKTNSLKAYKAEREISKALVSNKETIEKFFYDNHNIFPDFLIKKLESLEKESYSLIELINDRLVSSNITVTLDTYDIYKNNGIEQAASYLYFKSNII